MESSEMGDSVIPRKVIVVIDDEIRVFRTLRTLVEGHRLPYDVIYSPDIKDALGMIAEMGDFANIAMFVVDCCMDGSRIPNTVPIVEALIQKGYKGKILANSGDVDNTLSLLRAGAHEGCDKFNTIERILVALGLKY